MGVIVGLGSIPRAQSKTMDISKGQHRQIQVKGSDVSRLQSSKTHFGYKDERSFLEEARKEGQTRGVASIIMTNRMRELGQGGKRQQTYEILLEVDKQELVSYKGVHMHKNAHSNNIEGPAGEEGSVCSN